MSHVLLLIIAILAIIVILLLIPQENNNQRSCDVLNAKIQVMNQTLTSLDQNLLNGLHDDLVVLCPDGFYTIDEND